MKAAACKAAHPGSIPGGLSTHQPKEAVMFTLGLPVLIDGREAGWITGIGTMARKGQVVWVDIGGRLRLFAGSDLYRLESATAEPAGDGNGGAHRRAAAISVPPHPCPHRLVA
jgi:hypothetical protein